MRIALLGTRGIPANYGGFETFAEELSARLVKRGHPVAVYCRTNNVPKRATPYRGVDLKFLPTIPHKYFDTLAHTAISTVHALFGGYDAILYCNSANAVFSFAPRLIGVPTALNVDGLERGRRKWNKLGQAWYSLSERLSCWLPSETITDAAVIQKYYAERYNKSSQMIAYGADFEKESSTGALERLGLEPGQYFLYVSRMEPENNALLVAKAFARTSVPQRLALVGDAPYAADYLREVRSAPDSRIVMPGGIYGKGYRELQSHCLAYIHATEVGGTHPALIEAMGRGAPTLYLETPENAEVAGDAGMPFGNSEKALAALIEKTAAMAPAELEQWGRRAEERARGRYDWEHVADRYENLLSAMIQRRRSLG
jgi:glycosyltransferase involved in cell wall biosynthesis